MIFIQGKKIVDKIKRINFVLFFLIFNFTKKMFGRTESRKDHGARKFPNFFSDTKSALRGTSS